MPIPLKLDPLLNCFICLFRMRVSFYFLISKMDVNTLPFKYSDPDAPMKVLYLQEGKLAFWDMWKEYHEYLQEVINRYV